MPRFTSRFCVFDFSCSPNGGSYKGTGMVRYSCEGSYRNRILVMVFCICYLIAFYPENRNVPVGIRSYKSVFIRFTVDIASSVLNERKKENNQSYDE